MGDVNMITLGLIMTNSPYIAMHACEVIVLFDASVHTPSPPSPPPPLTSNSPTAFPAHPHPIFFFF